MLSNYDPNLDGYIINYTSTSNLTYIRSDDLLPKLLLTKKYDEDHCKNYLQRLKNLSSILSSYAPFLFNTLFLGLFYEIRQKLLMAWTRLITDKENKTFEMYETQGPQDKDQNQDHHHSSSTEVTSIYRDWDGQESEIIHKIVITYVTHFIKKEEYIKIVDMIDETVEKRIFAFDPLQLRSIPDFEETLLGMVRYN